MHARIKWKIQAGKYLEIDNKKKPIGILRSIKENNPYYQESQYPLESIFKSIKTYSTSNKTINNFGGVY